MGVFSKKEKETLNDTLNKYAESKRLQENLAAANNEVTDINCNLLKTEISEDLAEIADFFKQAAMTGVDCRMQISLVKHNVPPSFVAFDGVRISASLDEFYIEVYMDDYEKNAQGITDCNMGIPTYELYSSTSDGVHFAPYIKDTSTPFKTTHIRDRYYEIIGTFIGSWKDEIKPQIAQEILSRTAERNKALTNEIGVNSNKLERLEKKRTTIKQNPKEDFER